MVNIAMLNSTCRMLSAGVKFVAEDTHLTVRPCCLYKTEQKVDTKTDIDQWRQRMHATNSFTDPNCSTCSYYERRQIRNSRRQAGFKVIPGTADVGDPAWLEIQTDLICNGGCIMCGPEFSSFWAQELGVATPISKRKDHLEHINQLIDFQKTRHIIILGGEPMLSDTDERLLDYIQDPSQTSLQITTNGSIYPNDKKLESWSKFQKVLLNFSIDGIGNRFEYLRYPLKWDRVENNILKLQQQLPPNVKCKINHTLTSLNLYYYDEFVSWFDSTLKADAYNRGWTFTTTPASGLFSPQSVSHQLRRKVLEKYNNEAPDKAIEYISPSSMEIRKNLHNLDQRRKLDWKSVFPEIAHAL